MTWVEVIMWIAPTAILAVLAWLAAQSWIPGSVRVAIQGARLSATNRRDEMIKLARRRDSEGGEEVTSAEQDRILRAVIDEVIETTKSWLVRSWLKRQSPEVLLGLVSAPPDVPIDAPLAGKKT